MSDYLVAALHGNQVSHRARRERRVFTFSVSSVRKIVMQHTLSNVQSLIIWLLLYKQDHFRAELTEKTEFYYE